MMRTAHKRVLLLTTPRTYRAQPFVEAAGRLGVEVVKVAEDPPEVERGSPSLRSQPNSQRTYP